MAATGSAAEKCVDRVGLGADPEPGEYRLCGAIKADPQRRDGTESVRRSLCSPASPPPLRPLHLAVGDLDRVWMDADRGDAPASGPTAANCSDLRRIDPRRAAWRRDLVCQRDARADEPVSLQHLH